MSVRRMPWKDGPWPAEGEVVVSVTDFQVTRWLDQPRVWAQGLRLRRAWPSMEGAVGIWVWGEVDTRRSGSITVWRSEDDLRRFVRWPVHVAIMRRYRDRGTLRAETWRAEAADPATVWSDARRRIHAARVD